MSRSIEIPFKIFPEGWFVTWSVTSQCYFNGSVEIKSGGTVLQKIEKTDHDVDLQYLGHGNAIISSQDMSVVVTVEEGDPSEPIFEQHHASMIFNKEGDTVGITMAIGVEDANDFDFNDFFISFAGWAKKG